MNTLRKQIIETLKNSLEKDSQVFALWLEGADSMNSVDEYSDIDIVADVQDGAEEAVFQRIQALLTNIGELDFEFELPKSNTHLLHKVFHISGTSPHLLLDVVIQSHSRNFLFNVENPFEQPNILFDKQNVLKFAHLDPENQKTEIRATIINSEKIFYQCSKVQKYIYRKKYLEAYAYYLKTVLEPLINALRIKFTPYAKDYHLIHISKHFPSEIVYEIEQFYQVKTLNDIEANLEKAEKLFACTIAEIKKLYKIGVPI